MPAPRLPRSGPLWGTRDAPRYPSRGAPKPHRERNEADFQDSRFPGSHAHRRPRRSAAGWRRGGLGIWKPGNLAICRTHHVPPQSGRSMGT